MLSSIVTIQCVGPVAVRRGLSFRHPSSLMATAHEERSTCVVGLDGEFVASGCGGGRRERRTGERAAAAAQQGRSGLATPAYQTGTAEHEPGVPPTNPRFAVISTKALASAADYTGPLDNATPYQCCH